jgi:hypothetical protein
VFVIVRQHIVRVQECPFTQQLTAQLWVRFIIIQKRRDFLQQSV